MQSHKGDTSGKLEEMERNLHEGVLTGLDLYLLGRVYSILGIRLHHTGLLGQAFVRLVGTTGSDCTIYASFYSTAALRCHDEYGNVPIWPVDENESSRLCEAWFSSSLLHTSNASF